MRYLSNHGAHIRAKAEANACAVSFVRARAAELGNDDPNVVLTGFSEAGGRCRLFCSARWSTRVEMVSGAGVDRTGQCRSTT